MPQGLAKACPNLSDLDLSHNEFSGAFEARRNLPRSLLRLNAQGNRKMKSIDDDTLAPLSNLVLLGLKSCSLESLPGPALGKLTRLRELYVTDNRLRELPREIGRCTSLVKLQASFNLLETLPVAELAKLPKLEMLRAAACRISSLPGLEELYSKKKGKEKKSNNKGGFRSLCWLSLAGNPLFDACVPPPRPEAARVFSLDEVLSKGFQGEELGSGASGDVTAVRFDADGSGKKKKSSSSKCSSKDETISPPPPTLAFKRFRGDAGPDGRAVDEVSVARAVSHGALASTVGTVVAAAVEKEGKKKKKSGKGTAAASAATVLASSSTTTDLPHATASIEPSPSADALPAGLLLELIEGKPLADKPRGDPLLRCTWPKKKLPSSKKSTSNPSTSSTSSTSQNLNSQRLSPTSALVAAARLASGLAHLHADLGCAHGDFYAHNVLCEAEKGRATLVDFGAAFFYRRREAAEEEGEPSSSPPSSSSCSPPSSSAFEAFEQRAFGIFLRELAEHGIEEEEEGGGERGEKARKALERAAAAAADAPLAQRPGFSLLARELARAATEECGYDGQELCLSS